MASGHPGDQRTPSITVRPADGETTTVVLLLPGGKAESHAPARSRQLSAVRMVPFARALHRTGRDRGTAVWTLRYRYRGWNGAEASPVADARWALDEIRRRHGDLPVALVGHALGGRAALRVADDRSVHAVVALAPWLPTNEPVEAVRGRRVLIMHGTDDRWTDPRGSLLFARRAQPLARLLRRVEVRGVGHSMLRRSALWRGLTTYFVEESAISKAGSLRGPNINADAARAEVRLLV